MRRNSFSSISLTTSKPTESNLQRMLFSNICYCRFFQRRSFKSLITIFMIFSFFLYIILTITEFRHSVQHRPSKFEQEFPDEESRRSAIIINQQLERIEGSLRSNRLLINDLREELTRFGNQIHSPPQSFPITSVFHRSKCPATGPHVPALPLPGDINMLNVYQNLSFDNPDGGVWKQGWDIKINEEEFRDSAPLVVIVMPHSHNDPGWIKTFDTY